MATKMVKVVLGFEMPESTAKLFLNSALERVINSSLTIIEDQEGEDEHEYTEINQDDWAEWKPIVVALWYSIHNEVFCELNNIEHPSKFYQLQKGDV